MATNYIQKGDVLEHTPTAAAVASGDVVVMGATVGVALADIAKNATGSVMITGVFTVTKAAATAWAQGDKLDWDASASAFSKGITAATGDATACGIAAAAAASADTTGMILLTPGTGTAH